MQNDVATLDAKIVLADAGITKHCIMHYIQSHNPSYIIQVSSKYSNNFYMAPCRN